MVSQEYDVLIINTTTSNYLITSRNFSRLSHICKTNNEKIASYAFERETDYIPCLMLLFYYCVVQYPLLASYFFWSAFLFVRTTLLYFQRNMTVLASLGKSCFSRRFVASSFVPRGFASVGDQLPSVELHLGFPPEKHNLADFAKDKAIMLVGLPGAFTPTW